MSFSDWKKDINISITPILGPLSGGSWMTISPLAAVRAIFGSEPEKASSSKPQEVDPYSVVPVEIVKVPLDDQIIMEIKSYAIDDLLMTWEFDELRNFITSSLRDQVLNPDADGHTVLADLYDIKIVSNEGREGCEI